MGILKPHLTCCEAACVHEEVARADSECPLYNREGEDVVFERIEAFFSEKKWKNRKKTDWIAIALSGVLLLMIAMPASEEKNTNIQKQETTDTMDNGTDRKEEKEGEAQKYAAYLEEKLEKILKKMDGVGDVKVMITLADAGQEVVEKDERSRQNTVTETDANGTDYKTMELEIEQETVYVEEGNETYPYIGKEMLPTVEGVLVVAEGGDHAKVVSDISDTIMALFKLDAHKIKVVKMTPKED